MAGTAVASRQLLVPALTVVSILLIRPSILGELYPQIGAGLLLGAGFIGLVHDRSHKPQTVPARDTLLVVGLVIASYMLLLAELANSPVISDRYALTRQGGLLTCASLVGFAAVIRNRERALTVARWFIALVVVACASYVITAVVWRLNGVGSAQVGVVPVGDLGVQAAFFPFTPTAGVYTVFGQPIVRFTGIGREPGWMAMYCAVAFFLLPIVTKARWGTRALLVIGLLGTISSAGFGIFIIACAYWAFIRPRAYQNQFGAYLRQVGGLAVLGVAAWFAYYAPNLGFAAKQDVNAASYDERLRSFTAGLHALQSLQWFGDFGPTSITLAGGVASQGLLWVLLILAAFLLPRISHSNASLTTAPIMVIVLTLLLAQPVGDGTWVFGLAMLCYATAEGASSPLEPTTHPTGENIGSETGLARGS